LDKRAENIKGKGFDKRPENINRKGQPPKIMSGVLKELTAAGYERVTMAMVVEAYEILMGLPEAKIKEMITDSQQIMSLRIVGKAMLSTKGSEMLEKMLDRAHGKPKLSTELSTKDGEPLSIKNIHLLTTEEILKELDNSAG
jgi:hypothetical protein